MTSRRIGIFMTSRRLGVLLTSRRLGGSAALALLLATPFTDTATAQQIGAGTGGTAALHQAERMVGKNKRVLMIGAHPDDEDTELLTALVRGEGAEAAYLSLSRGEGGQNLIGPELGEALGLIRTEELLGARALDGARQYFTRAFDFGFSRSIEETAGFWPRDSVLKDVVRIIRRFRPQVLVAVFSGTPRDGHGQHQMSGWAAQEGFRVAGDPTRFPELSREGLAPWQPLKLYRSTRFDPNATTLTLNVGVLDPDIGQSYRQIAMRGRSLHRSQDMGVLQEPGPSTVRMMLMADRATGTEGGLWSGIDTTVASLDPNGIEMQDQRRHRAEAAGGRARLVFDAYTPTGRIIPGEKITVVLQAWNAGVDPVATSLELIAPRGWTVTPCANSNLTVAPGTMATCNAQVAVPADAEISTPYFLRVDRGPSALYVWSGAPSDWGEPFEAPPLVGRFTFSGEKIAGGPHLSVKPVVHRYRDQAIGEVRHPVFVVPRVDVKLDPPAKIWSTGWKTPQPLTVTLQHGGKTPTTGTVTLELPTGWPAVAPQPFALTRFEERESIAFAVRAPPGLARGSYRIRAIATDSAGHRYDAGLYEVTYSHIRPRVYARPARTTIEAAELTLPRVAKVGYVRGASDKVPEALLGIGLPLELISDATLERGDLSSYDVIVIGSRAYEVSQALVDNNNRLLEYAAGGGRVVVQYQQQPFFNGNFAPAPLTLASPHDRVTNENAPVNLLMPNHPIFNRPNRIDPSDWAGWVQERGLYFARTWDSTYTALLSLSDPGAAPLRGGLLVRPVGKGSWIYTGFSFFRQLPAAVPGAFRFFLNLIAPLAPTS
jgi:LmbE family N-acetylglucosaminyl deacetylase